MEIWKKVPGFDNYEVSNYGRVKSFQTGKGKILKHSFTGGGYPKITLCKDKKHFTVMVHRVVTGAFFGLCPAGYEVNHINGIKTDNHLDNLEYCTRGQNNQHAYNSGLHTPVVHTQQAKNKMSISHTGKHKGEDNIKAKLSKGDVLTIRSLRNRDNIPRDWVAQLFGVHPSTIYSVETRKTWGHI